MEPLSLVEAQARVPLTRIRGAQAPRTGIIHFRFWLKKIRGRGMTRARKNARILPYAKSSLLSFGGFD